MPSAPPPPPPHLWPAMLCKRRRHLLPSDEPGAVRIKLLEGLEQQFVLVQPLLVHCRRQKLLVVDDAVGVDVSTSEHQAGLLLSKLHALLGQRTLQGARMWEPVKRSARVAAR
eukprot:349797-Chlamydomonas_euryale.AAC.2